MVVKHIKERVVKNQNFGFLQGRCGFIAVVLE